MKHAAAFLSSRDDWETPQAFFDHFNRDHFFDIDACASHDNAKCALYFTKEQDALQQDWVGSVWMNPPYSHGIGAWIRKAYEEVDNQHAEKVVCLIPARTCTAWWHDYVMHADHIWLIRGRMRFGGSTTNAPFPSAVVVFTFRPYKMAPDIFTMDRILDERPIIEETPNAQST